MAAAKETAPKKDKGRRIKVRATRVGFHDQKRRREGNVFPIYESEFSDAWMERVPSSTPELQTSGVQELKKQHDDILATRAGAVGAGGDDAGEI